MESDDVRTPIFMHRDTRATYAQETLRILELGQYAAGDGRCVEIGDALRNAVDGTRLFALESLLADDESAPRYTTEITVERQTTLQALAQLAAQSGGHLACLNFASAKNPGGGFLGGAQAQEESLARSSGLYPCLLKEEAGHYAANRSHRSALYLDLAIYSPGVPFFRDDDGRLLDPFYTASVITCAAPNAGAVASNEPGKLALVEPTLARRAEFVLRIARRESVRRLVLGAWGCGVFRNDPRMVAATFARLLDRGGTCDGWFEQVVFAVYDSSPGGETWRAFESAFAK